MSKDSRTRVFATVVYPDSAPEDWKDILARECIPCFVSPLHDQDVNPTGESKKAHYHVMLMFDGKKSVDQVKEIFGLVGGVGCEIVKSTRGYARYLCHLDNPEKHQYDVGQVAALGGTDYMSVISLASDKYYALGEMQDFCDRYNVTSFYLLANYARKNREDWYRILCDSGTVYIKEWLKSKRWSLTRHDVAIVNPETGEVIE